MEKGIEPFSIEEERKIIRDCVKAADNIEDMTDRAYNFLYGAGGFIARYDKGGFKEYYYEHGSLKKDIPEYRWENQYCNFRPKDEGYEYYMRHRKIYNTICECLKNNIEFKPEKKMEKTAEFDFGW
jgi:hypothetical protein